MPDKDPVPTAGDLATRTPSHSIPNTSEQVHEQCALEHRGDAFVEQVEEKAAAAGDPYFGKYAEDADDDRASAGTRTPIYIDAPKGDA